MIAEKTVATISCLFVVVIRYNPGAVVCVLRDNPPGSMRDDQRSDRDNDQNDVDDIFDDALDDLFGPDDEDAPPRPEPPVQAPQSPGGPEPPTDVFESDPDHRHDDAVHEHPTGDHDLEGHVIGPDNAPPPPSYSGQRDRSSHQTSETSIPVAPARSQRNWRRIACFGCLAAVGLPALCLGALIVIGIVAGDSTGSTPTVAGVFVDEPTPTTFAEEEVTESAPVDEPYRTIMDGRQEQLVAIDGRSDFGSLSQPVPIGSFGPVGGGWDLQINEITIDANEIVAETNMFNDPPADDRQYVIANISVENNTGSVGLFDPSFRLRLVGGETGTAFTTFDESDRCGVIPEPFDDADMEPGELRSGNVCWQVLIDDLDSLVLYNQSFSEDDLAIWFDLTSQSASAP